MDSSDSSYLLLEKSECVECARHRCKSARPEWKNTSLLGFLSFTCVFLLLILSRYMFLQTFAQEEFAETPCVQKELVPGKQFQSKLTRCQFTKNPSALGSLKCRIIQPDAQSWNNTLYTGRPALESDLAWTELQTGAKNAKFWMEFTLTSSSTGCWGHARRGGPSQHFWPQVHS